jgi:hypothetical protein
MGVKQTVLERMENNKLKWLWLVLRMEDNTWPKRIMTWSQEGRRRRRGREVERVMKQKNLTTWRRRKPATVAKSDWEPVTGVTLGNWYKCTCNVRSLERTTELKYRVFHSLWPQSFSYNF